MIVYRITKNEYSEDLSGRGSFLNGGRWNSVGKYALYTSSHRSLALLELLVHIPLEIVARSEYQILSLELPEILDVPFLTSIENARSQGDAFLKENKHLFFSVPSVIFPEERNIIVNPLQEGFSLVKVLKSENLIIDGRLI